MSTSYRRRSTGRQFISHATCMDNCGFGHEVLSGLADAAVSLHRSKTSPQIIQFGVDVNFVRHFYD